MKSTIKVFRVLETLCEGKAASVTELSNQLDVKPSSMLNMVRLETFIKAMTDISEKISQELGYRKIPKKIEP
jgi:hypothetical protein